MPTEERKETDDVSGPSAPAHAHPHAHADSAPGALDPADPLAGLPAQASDNETDESDEVDPLDPFEGQGPGTDPDAVADPPPAVAELAAACVRFVAASYGVMPDFSPDTLSLVDQWVRDARTNVELRPESEKVVESAAGAYLGEVIRRHFGGRWFSDGDPSGWRLYLSTVYCAFNPIGMAREALMLETADGWHAHFELDPGERDAIDARLAALPEVEDEEFYAPSTRFDVVSIVVAALREAMRGQGLSDVRFTPDDYDD